MAKDKVITVMCAARLPEMLVKRVDAAAASGGVSRAQFIAEACRMRLDGAAGSRPIARHMSEPPQDLNESGQVSGSGKPDMASLRAICAGDLIGKPLTMEDVEAMRPDLPCSVCELPMREVKGKWACSDVSCSKYGVEQKPR